MTGAVQRLNSALRMVPPWLVYAVGVLPPVWLYYQGLTGQLGVDPVRRIERELGLLSLQVLIAVLAVTPLRRFAGLNLIRYRRALGLLCFGYVVVHLLTWLLLDIQLLWAQIGADLVKRPYITIGWLGFAVMVPLALTSNNRAIRRLGPTLWQRLHWLTYLAVLAGGVHFVMVRKGLQLEPLIYLGVIVWLLLLRLGWALQRLAARRRAVPA